MSAVGMANVLLVSSINSDPVESTDSFITTPLNVHLSGLFSSGKIHLKYAGTSLEIVRLRVFDLIVYRSVAYSPVTMQGAIK